VFDLYEGREGDLVTGIVQQSDHRYAILDLGNAEAIMPSSERIPYERLERGNRLKAYILEVRGEGKGPQIVVSRSHPEFIRSLFELEVPELVDGDVEIRAIAREPGHRTKIAVASNDPNVDPVGACVGARGSRVRQVVNELRGEKVDIVEWRDDTKSFIAEGLSPARVKEVRLDDEAMIATVIVPDHQLSLAIGKEGQNARLAARLTGYKIDIKSESQDLGLDLEEEDLEAAATEQAAEAVADGGTDVEAAAEAVAVEGAAEAAVAEELDEAAEVVAAIEDAEIETEIVEAAEAAVVEELEVVAEAEEIVAEAEGAEEAAEAEVVAEAEEIVAEAELAEEVAAESVDDDVTTDEIDDDTDADPTA
jgi:N utilization substance protein A